MTGIVGVPLLHVEMAIGYTPGHVRAGTAVWTDISATSGVVRLADGISWERGRAGERDQVSPGRASFTINTKKYAATYGDPPALRTPVRISHGSPTPTVLWTGTIDQWDGSWLGGVKPVTRVSATEILSRASRRTLRALPVEAQKYHGPVALFPCDEEEAAGSLASIIPQTGGAAGRLKSYSTVGTTGTATWGAGFSPGSIRNSAESTVASFTGDGSNYVQLSSLITEVKPATTGVTFEAMILPSAWPSGGSTYPLILGGRDTDDWFFALGLTNTGNASVAWGTGTMSGGITGSGGTLSITQWNHLAVTVTAGGSVRLFLNGTQEGSTTSLSASLFGVLKRVTVGAGLWNGNIANIGVYASRLSDADVADDLASGRDGYNGEETTSRAASIGTYCGWPVQYSLGALVTMGPQPTKGVTLFDALQQCADTEGSPLWMDASGVFHLDPRTDRYTPGAAAFTIPATVIDPGTVFGKSDVGVINQATVTDAAGTRVYREDADSVAAHDPYPVEVSTYVTNDDTGVTAMESLAEGLAHWNADPSVRSESIVVDLITGAASITGLSACIAADVGDVFALTGLPTDHGTSSSMLFYVEGVSDQASHSAWTRTFNVSPADKAAWVLGDSTYGVLGSTTRLGF